MHLSREIRFALVSPAELAAQPRPTNSWAGWPNTNRIAPQLVLKAVVTGTPDRETGYLCNIKLLDDLLRKIVAEKIIPAFATTANDCFPTAESVLKTVFDAALACQATHPIQNANIASISLSLSPYLHFAIDTEKPNMIQLTQQFEFSAAHRLHCDSLTDEENKAMFGKCNNPAGHGHNYVVEVTLGREIDDKGAVKNSNGLIEFEKIVKSQVVDRLDHKHLNKDIAYFSTVNPSVENISIAIWNWLDGPLSKIDSPNSRLISVKVFETPKTWALYAGPNS